MTRLKEKAQKNFHIKILYLKYSTKKRFSNKIKSLENYYVKKRKN